MSGTLTPGVGIRLLINGQPHALDVDPRAPLVHVLRDEVGLTGVRFGCLSGHCGACTVLLNGQAVKACTVLAVSADGDEIVTVEGLAGEGGLHPLQEAFWTEHGFQCGFCTPGMMLTAVELLRDADGPTAEEIRKGISGNLCRCTGYEGILRAIAAAAVRLKTTPPP